MPDQTVNTFFARIIGLDKLKSSAESEAQAVRSGTGTGIPLAIQPNQGSPTDLLCIRMDRKCGNGPTNQATRIIDSPLVGNWQYKTVRSCGSMWSPPGDSTPGSDSTLYTRAASNVAMGLDHQVVLDQGANRNDDCGPLMSPRTNPLLPNWIYATEFDNLAGNDMTAARAFTDGIAAGLLSTGLFSDGLPGRLLRTPAGWPTRTLALGSSNPTVDDRPLWDYIRPGNPSLPPVCQRQTFQTRDSSDPDNTGPSAQHMANCLAAWTPGYGPLFDARTGSTPAGMYDIQFSPRAGVFPLVGTPGNTNYPPSPITGFQTGYIHTLYFAATSTTNPYTEYNPGAVPTDDPIVGTPASLTGKYLVGLAVFRIKDGMLPPIAQPNPSTNLNGTVSLIR